MAMISSVFASARALTLRFPRGSFASRFTSPMISLRLHGPRQAVVQRRIAEFRECLEAIGNVEMAVRDRVLPRRAAELALAAGQRDHLLGDVAKRGRSARRDVEDATAAVSEDEPCELRDVVDEHVVALLLALAEQRNGFALLGQPAKSIGPVAVVRIARAVEEARSEEHTSELQSL